MADTCGSARAGAVMQACVRACRVTQLSSLPEPAPSHPSVISLAQDLPQGENKRLIQKYGVQLLWGRCSELLGVVVCTQSPSSKGLGCSALALWLQTLFLFYPRCLQ